MKRIAVPLVLAALVACHADQMMPSPPSALIRDAGHNGGNFFFAFLQPMVSQPTRNGVFDATQSPTVKVALLLADASCTDPHLTYTMSTGPGGDASETVRVNATDGNYIVNLHTDKVAVTSGCTYRIRVFIGLIELGFADIQLFLTQGAAKNLTDNETVGLVDGKTLPIKFWIAQGVLRDVGQGTASPDHETVIVTQNLKAGVLIPAGAVSAPTTILIESVDDRPCFPGLVGQTFQGLPGATDNSCYRFRTDPPLPNGQFNTPVIVGLCVDLSRVTVAQRPKIQIFQFDAADLRLPDRIKALPNASAPFLRCGELGIGLGKRGILDFAAHLFTSLLSPKPLLARSRAVVFDLGAGGSTEGFSTFTWGLVTDMAKNAGDLQMAAVGTAVAMPPSVIFTDSAGGFVDSVPVTFSLGSGGGSITDAVTKSGRGGVSGVAQVGSWTLGSVGANTLVASAPAFSGVTPPSVTFTATGTATLSGYEVVTSSVFSLAATGGFIRETADCPTGKVVLGGGTQVVGEGTADFKTRLQESGPGTVGGGAQSVWLVSIKNEDINPHNVQIFAVCVNPPSGYEVVASSVFSLTAAGGFIRETADCPAGKVVLGGGAQVVAGGTTDFKTQLQESGPGTVGGGAQTVWLASIKNEDVNPHNVQIFAVCANPPTGYEVVASSTFSLTPTGGFVRDIAQCPTGKVVLGGGTQVVAEGTADFKTRLQESTPGTTGLPAQSVWLVSIKNQDGSAHSVAIKAACANAS